MARKGTENFHTVVTPNRTLKIRLADEVLIYDAELSAISPRVLFCGLVGVWAIIPNPSINIGNMKFVQHIKEIFLVEKIGQRNSQEENEKKKFSQKFPALWTRASESGYSVQIFGSVSVIWGLVNIFKS
jgi:hypothetical protein